MLDAGEGNALAIIAEQMIDVWRVAVIAAVVNVASVIQNRILMVRNEILRTRRPTAVFWALKHPIIAALRQRGVGGRCFYSGVGFDQFLVPPPDVLTNSAGDYAVLARNPVPVVAAILEHREVGLFEIVQTLGLDGAGLGAREGGQEHCRQNRDDGDDDQQLNERERGARMAFLEDAVFHYFTCATQRDGPKASSRGRPLRWELLPHSVASANHKTRVQRSEERRV